MFCAQVLVRVKCNWLLFGVVMKSVVSQAVRKAAPKRSASKCSFSVLWGKLLSIPCLQNRYFRDQRALDSSSIQLCRAKHLGRFLSAGLHTFSSRLLYDLTSVSEISRALGRVALGAFPFCRKKCPHWLDAFDI